MRLFTSAVATLAAALTVVRAANPSATIGHTAILIDKTVFIQGGSSTLNTAQNSAFSLILGSNGTLANSTLIDHTAFSQFRARDYAGSISTNGLMVNCGSMDQAPTSGAFSCDIFNVMKYNSTPMANVPTSAVSRGGLAATVADDVAYFIGGSGANDTFSKTVNVLVLGTMDQLKWRVDADMPNPTRYHTANFVSGVGVVVLGGQVQGGAVLSMNSASILNAGNWTTRAIAGDPCPGRFGHTAVLSESGMLYVYGGKPAAAIAPLNDLFVLDTKASTWAWKKLSASTAEPRAFHASVLLNDGNLLHIFGQAGLGPDTAVNTFSTFNVKSNVWTAASPFPTATVATESPVKTTGSCNNPSNPECDHPTGDGDGSGNSEGGNGKKANVGLIAGVTVAALLILLVGGFLFRRHRNGESMPFVGGNKRSNNTDTDASALKRLPSTHGDSGELGGGKLGRSFTIRKPPSVYVENDQELDQTHYPRYNGAQDARNNPYYGDRQYSDNHTGVIEYELSDTSGQKYGPSSVAERKKYVEQQQKEVMDKYDMFDRFDKQNAPSSPYSSQAPTLNGNPRSPTAGGARSPRTEFQQPSYGGRQQQNQREGYY